MRSCSHVSRHLLALSLGVLPLLTPGSGTWAWGAEDLFPQLEQHLASATTTAGARGGTGPIAGLQYGTLASMTQISGPTLADAINGSLQRRQAGATIVKGSDGLGFAATGLATYPKASDSTVLLLNRRAALLRAWLAAKVELSKAVAGQTVAGRTAMFEAFVSHSDPGGTRSASIQAQAQSVDMAIAACLSGVVTWAVDEDPTTSTVYVTIASTPRSRSLAGRHGGLLLVGNTLRDGLIAALTELRTGVAPPLGARVVTVTSGPGLALVGYGSAVIRPNPNPDLAQRLRASAEKQAEMLALDSLVGAVHGDFTVGHASMSEEASAVVNEFIATPAELVAGVKTRLSHVTSLKETAQSLRQGTLPGNVRILRWTSDQGQIAWATAVLLPPVEALTAVAPPAQPVSGPVTTTETASKPAWMQQRPADAEFLYGIGEAPTRDLSTSLARLDLGQQILIRLDGFQANSSVLNSSISDTGSNTQALDVMVQQVRVRLDERTYRGAEVVAQSVVGNVVYTLVRMPRTIGARDLAQRLAELDARLEKLDFADVSLVNRGKLLRAVGDHMERLGVAKQLAALGQTVPASPLADGAFAKALGRLADGITLRYEGEASGPTRDAVLGVIAGWGLSFSPHAGTRLGLRCTTQSNVRMTDGWYRVNMTCRVELLLDGGVAGQLSASGDGDSSESQAMAEGRAVKDLGQALNKTLASNLFDLLAGPRN